MAPLATSTTSTDSSTAGPLLRKTSRSSRFARFLWTAPPTFLLATKPTRNPPPVVTRTKATKRGLTHRRPSRYARSKSALRRRVGGRPRSPPERLSVKPRGGAAPCAGGERGRLGRPWIAFSRESHGSGCVGVDSAGTFFSFRYDSRLATARADLTGRSPYAKFPSKRNQTSYSSEFSLSTRLPRAHPLLFLRAYAGLREFFLVGHNPIC